MDATLHPPGRGSRIGTNAGTLIALSLTMLLASLGTSIANVGLPALAQAFEATFQQVQWVVLAYLLAVTTAVVTVGRVGDLIGRKRLLMGGILLFTAAALLAGLAQTLWLLIAARGIQGIGAAIMMATSMALVSETAVGGRVGTAMGLLGTSSAVGTALGPSLGGLLIAVAGWRSIFLVMIPIGALAFALIRAKLPERASGSGKGRARLDALGTMLLALTLAAFALSMTLGRGSFGTLNLALLGAAVSGLILFLWSQSVATSPLVQLTEIGNPTIALGLAMSLLVSTILMATLVVGPFYLGGALALGAPAIGRVLSLGPLAVACSGVPAGRKADKFGTNAMTLVGLTAILVGSVALSLAPAKLGLFGYVPSMLILTIGYGVFQTANNVSVMLAASPGQNGVMSGLLNLSRNLGLVAGASGMAAVFASAIGTTHITSASQDAVAGAMQFTFKVAALLILVALALAVSRSFVGGRRANSR